ncbi:hypothetical protein HMPREF3038_01211 [Akkermansia sp. KLE1797]|nr:hypothetical protein HMPREF3038_01211 [Akkermansia sp. KLE1797]KXU52879.1 hypothetical protein HMPREF3039_03045 [Akkermansia sp. KLE1798]KZA04158.1 hypothetical protein HMPREF1326_02081 [Akkermansia sp. KLE1605]
MRGPRFNPGVGRSTKYRRERTRQTRTSYRCYLSVLAGFASRASTGSRRLGQ